MTIDSKLTIGLLAFCLVCATALAWAHRISPEIVASVFGGVIGWASHIKKDPS